MKSKTLSVFVIILLMITSCKQPCEEIPAHAFISFDRNRILFGESISFSAETQECNESYSWTFEGGIPATSTDPNPVVEYPDQGIFNVALTVTSKSGDVKSDIRNKLVVVGCEGLYCEKLFTSKRTDKVVYGIDSEQHLMHVYEPENDDRTARPLIVMFGGGGGTFGSNLEYLKPFAEMMAGYGFVVATARYRVRENFDPTFLIQGQQDSKALVRYFRKEAEQWKIDTDLIFNGGHATGAILALWHAYIKLEEIPQENYEWIESLGGYEGEQGSEGFSSEVAGCISLAGEMYSHNEWIDGGEPPLFMVHGTADEAIACGLDSSPDGTPNYGSCELAKRAKEVGLKHYLHLISGGSHSAPRVLVGDYEDELMLFIREVIGDRG